MEYAVVLVAALAHAIWNGLVKSSDDKLLSLTFVRLIGFVMGLIIVVSLPSIGMAAIPYVFAASFIHFAYFYCLINAYKLGDFSQVYPISRGLAPLLVLLIGLFLSNDFLGRGQIAGTLLICLGLMLLAVGGQKIQTKVLWFCVATACCIAGYTLVSGMGVRLSGSFWVYAGWLELVTGAGVLIFSGIRRKKHLLRYASKNWQLGSVTGVLSIGGYVAALWAMTHIPISSVAALRETSIIFAVLIGVFFFKESFGLKRIWASILVVCGISVLIFA